MTRLVTVAPPLTVGVIVIVFVVRRRHEHADEIWLGCAFGGNMVGVSPKDNPTLCRFSS